MTFDADGIINHVRSMAGIWREQELESLRTKDIMERMRGLTPDERAIAVRQHELAAMKAHQSAIVLDMLANDLLDMEDKLSEKVRVSA